jgi:hypothetical protein
VFDTTMDGLSWVARLEVFGGEAVEEVRSELVATS